MSEASQANVNIFKSKPSKPMQDLQDTAALLAHVSLLATGGGEEGERRGEIRYGARGGGKRGGGEIRYGARGGGKRGGGERVLRQC
eukprot:601491-Hanusia_phi.AAC.2